MCLFCSKVLAADSMRPGKLKRHLETTHSKCIGKPKEFFQRKLDEFTKQKQAFKKNSSFSIKCITSIVLNVLQNREV